MARVPLMPTNQSASERQRAASASGFICASVRRAVKPSRMAAGVIDCSHSLFTGCLLLAYCSMSRKISSPSRPASQALTSVPTSLRLISLTMALSRVLVLSIGLRSKYGGITGRLAKLHLPRLTSNSSGAWISTRWPTAEVTIQSSPSKYSSCFSNLPAVGVRARTMSCATEGFSAITSVFIRVLKSCPFLGTVTNFLPYWLVSGAYRKASAVEGVMPHYNTALTRLYARRCARTHMN